MGYSFSQSAKVEVLAPPAVVRSIFLDFARYKQWNQGWAIEPVDASKKPSGKPPAELAAGDRIKVHMSGMVFHPSVAENSTNCVAWDGSLWGLIGGKHHFIFSPSEVNPGGTTFIQREDFHGPLTILFWPWRNRELSSESWDAFNVALKKEAEKSGS